MQKTMWMLGIVSCIMVSCRESAGNEYETLNKMAAEEYRTPLRPGYEGRNPYWNVYAKRFLYAPAFDFQEKDGAREYLFRISSDDGRREWTFTADAPWRPLSPVWDSVAVGNVSLTVLAIGQDGEVLDTAGTRRFFRDYPFHAPYNGPAVPYRESALKAALYIHSLPFVQRFATETEPDLASYPHFSCACKVIGALISNECLIARELPSRRDEALAIALGAANFLLSISQPDNAPLAHFPPTYYKGELQEKDEHRGKTITVEAAKGVGPAFLDLYELTGDRKWLLRAIGIARTYQRLQRSDGSFPIKMDFDTGQPVNDAPAMLHPLLNFLSRLHRQYGINEFLPMQEAGERWMREVPLKSFDMEGQFEDVSVMGLQPYENLTNCTAAPYADYLLRKEDPTEEDISNAIDLIRLSEDQFVHWDYPLGPDDIHKRCAPAVHEQYKYETPIDNSSCNVANAMLSLYEKTGDRLMLAKAKALIDHLTVMQHQNSGVIPTAFVFRPVDRDIKTQITLNCCYADVLILMRMHRLMAAEAAADDKKQNK
ncbi:MAG: hypothetical protein II746_05855 [Bacteroidaceae bacterium]|nr:hypothetical protein [Bacteroidaceae bacterium]